jgi:hypothetical protein
MRNVGSEMDSSDSFDLKNEEDINLPFAMSNQIRYF